MYNSLRYKNIASLAMVYKDDTKIEPYELILIFLLYFIAIYYTFFHYYVDGSKEYINLNKYYAQMINSKNYTETIMPNEYRKNDLKERYYYGEVSYSYSDDDECKRVSYEYDIILLNYLANKGIKVKPQTSNWDDVGINALFTYYDQGELESIVVSYFDELLFGLIKVRRVLQAKSNKNKDNEKQIPIFVSSSMVLCDEVGCR